MRITVFTPTYNRAYIIENLYHSLQRQTFRDFEWVVVDDGSTDNTETLFLQILNEDNFFPIRYVKTENGGKHRAINKGVSMATGDLFFIVDSDDYITDDALETIDSVEKSIPIKEKHTFAGVCGLSAYSPAKIIGTTFDGEFLDITMLERSRYNITGDKAEVFYTKIMCMYPFPCFDNENFLTECVVWDKIAHDGYLLRFFNTSIKLCDYLPDGLTAKGWKLMVDNPKGYGLYLAQCGQYKQITGSKKWNLYISYYYSLYEKVSIEEIARNLHVSPALLWFRVFWRRIVFKFQRMVGAKP